MWPIMREKVQNFDFWPIFDYEYLNLMNIAKEENWSSCWSANFQTFDKNEIKTTAGNFYSPIPFCFIYTLFLFFSSDTCAQVDHNITCFFQVLLCSLDHSNTSELRSDCVQITFRLRSDCVTIEIVLTQRLRYRN